MDASGPYGPMNVRDILRWMLSRAVGIQAAGTVDRKFVSKLTPERCDEIAATVSEMTAYRYIAAIARLVAITMPVEYCETCRRYEHECRCD